MFRSCSQLMPRWPVAVTREAELSVYWKETRGQIQDMNLRPGGGDWGERGVDISAPCPGWVAESRLMDGSETMFMFKQSCVLVLQSFCHPGSIRLRPLVLPVSRLL